MRFFLNILFFTISISSIVSANDIRGLAGVNLGEKIPSHVKSSLIFHLQERGTSFYKIYGKTIAGYSRVEVLTHEGIIYEIEATTYFHRGGEDMAFKEIKRMRKQLEKKYNYKFTENSASNKKNGLVFFTVQYDEKHKVKISLMAFKNQKVRGQHFGDEDGISTHISLENYSIKSKIKEKRKQTKINSL